MRIGCTPTAIKRRNSLNCTHNSICAALNLPAHHVNIYDTPTALTLRYRQQQTYIFVCQPYTQYTYNDSIRVYVTVSVQPASLNALRKHKQSRIISITVVVVVVVVLVKQKSYLYTLTRTNCIIIHIVYTIYTRARVCVCVCFQFSPANFLLQPASSISIASSALTPHKHIPWSIIINTAHLSNYRWEYMLLITTYASPVHTNIYTHICLYAEVTSAPMHKARMCRS